MTIACVICGFQTQVLRGWYYVGVTPRRYVWVCPAHFHPDTKDYQGEVELVKRQLAVDIPMGIASPK